MCYIKLVRDILHLSERSKSFIFYHQTIEEDGENIFYQYQSLLDILTKIIVPTLFGIIAFLGVIGNTLVIIVVLTNPQMRSTTNVLILNLAVADLLFVIFCIPFTATDYVINEWRFGLVVCKSVQYLIYTTSYVSIYTLILMTIDRFLAVVFPVNTC